MTELKAPAPAVNGERANHHTACVGKIDSTEENTNGALGYAKAATTYWDAGWRGVLPLKHKVKGGKNSGLPVGFTGHDGAVPSYPDILQWSEIYPHGNLCLRMPDGIIGIDVDHYGEKRGGETIIEAERRWGALPGGPRSTSRDDDSVSGIRLFRVPPGTVLEDGIEFKDQGLGDVEICQRHHRYVVCWPSIHPEGRAYWWRNERMQHKGIPHPDELPWLPDAWVDGLRAKPKTDTASSDLTPVEIKSTWTPGPMTGSVRERLSEAINACYGGSRHDNTRDHSLALMRLGKRGQTGVNDALMLLGTTFVAAVVADGSRTENAATAEFESLVTGPSVPELLAERTSDDWLIDLMRQHGQLPVQQLEKPDGNNVAVDTAAAAAPGAEWLEQAIDQRVERLRVDREARRRLDAEENPPVPIPPLKTLDQLLAEPESPTVYRIERLMPESSRVVLAAQKKSGKTVAMGNLARSLADGEPFLDSFAVNTAARGLFWIDNELSEDMTRRWLRLQGIKNTAAVVGIQSLRGRVAAFDIRDDKRRAEWARQIADSGADFVILDCLRPVLDALGLDENREAGKFLVPFDALLTEAGVTNALVIHHMGHSGEHSRGDSRIEDWPDVAWRMVKQNPADPRSVRYFSAYGRDVDVPEGRLTFNLATKHLKYVGGSRADTKSEAALGAVVDLLRRKPGLGVREVQRELASDDLPESERHTQAAARAALLAGKESGLLVAESGSGGAHHHRIAYPCAVCGKPVASRRERHETCLGGDK